MVIDPSPGDGKHQKLLGGFKWSPKKYIEGPWSMGMIIPNAVEHEKKTDFQSTNQPITGWWFQPL